MSTIKVNTVETRTGSTLTLGKSGDTVAIASGASTSGMGRTGTVDWETTVKTESFTGVNGKGYFIDTLDSGSPFKNYAVTVATGTQYIVGGSGNVFNLDGSQQTAITLMKGKTYRFTQSDATNDGHQLIISTSNSTTLGTFQGGIVSSGITYYIDGSATQSNWLNSTTFNAGTTRYIEFQPQATGTFYFGCYNHGIGMGGAITSEFLTLNLPAGSAGNIISIADYSKSFYTNTFRIKPNGSEKIGGVAESLTLDSENGSALTLVYVDSTKGWVNTQFTSDQKTGLSYTSATGGNTVATCGNFKIHTFTGPGTFTVCSVGTFQDGKVDYLVVAGGGSGGGRYAGGGGGGGFRESSGAVSGCYSASPLGSGVSALTVSATGYPITVGGGGASVPATPGTGRGSRGSNSIFSSITSTGGGGGGGQNNPENPTYMPGGSGGGNSYNSPSVPFSAGSGNTPPVSPPQGKDGGKGYPGGAPYSAGGGGGATEAGVSSASNASGRGGAGASTGITGSSVAYAGGGGGSGSNDPNAQGAASPCGTGGRGGGTGPIPASGVAGTTNRGGGGGGAYHPSSGDSGAGGSGVVIIRYRYQ